MAAGQGFKTFTTGEVLTAGDVNGYLMQGVLVFASAAARDAAITSPQEGQFAYLKDTNVTTYYTGSAWANLDTTGMTNPMTTTGDTIYSSSGSTPARLGIGSTGQVLTVASGLPSWATPAASGGTTLISEQVFSGSSGYQFASIPGTYKNLILTWDGLNESAISTDFGLRFNNVSTTIYKEQYQYQETGSASALGTTAGTTAGYACFGVHVTNTAADKMALGQIIIYDYASSTKNKYYQMQYSYYSNNNARVNFWSVLGYFESTTAITTLDIVRGSGSATLSNTANTSVRLYGVS
jgi:hypothetical protein